MADADTGLGQAQRTSGPDGYTSNEHTVEVHGAMREADYREVERIQGERLDGRFKEWAEHFVFECPDGVTAARLIGFLRERGYHHTLTLEWGWGPPSTRSTTAPAPAA